MRPLERPRLWLGCRHRWRGRSPVCDTETQKKKHATNLLFDLARIDDNSDVINRDTGFGDICGENDLSNTLCGQPKSMRASRVQARVSNPLTNSQNQYCTAHTHTHTGGGRRKARCCSPGAMAECRTRTNTPGPPNPAWPASACCTRRISSSPARSRRRCGRMVGRADGVEEHQEER